ncbi:MAG: PQQ-like beta-propeller repeat protein, partial [Pyrinomonadaceae bacterium]|nr:PQQ-like beta-propeller repeat protein [Pyrinomonadaceae bacterium]
MNRFNVKMKMSWAAMLLLCLSVEAASQTKAEWPQWRGPNRDGISKETGLLRRWPADGPPLAWKASGAGRGFSSMSVANNLLHTMGLRGDREYIIAFDLATGKEAWATPHGAAYRDSRGDGPRGTPTIDGDRLYALGGNGDLSCLDAKTGRSIWAINILQKFGGSNTRWGISESPLVLGDRVLVNAGGRGASVVALNKKDGSLIWKSQGDSAGYSSAIPIQVNGATQVVFFTSERAIGLDPRDGRLLWEYPRPANNVANIATPVARGNRVFISSDYGTGGGVVEIKAVGDKVTAEEIYFTKDMRNHHSTSILVGDHLYGFSSGILTAMRFDSGQVAWRDRSVGKGQVITAEGLLYLQGEDGVAGLAEATPAGYREISRFTFGKADYPTWTLPVIADGRLYIRDQDRLNCYDIR